MVIGVQDIRTRWSKQSRGGAAAARRNAVPQVLALPLANQPSPHRGVLQHTVFFDEAQGFAPPARSVLTPQEAVPLRVGAVQIEPGPAWVTVTFEYDARVVGRPFRYAPPGGIPSTRFVLEVGQWGRVRYNGRFSDDEWWYEQRVVNVGLFGHLEPGVFIATEPRFTISELAHLR
jgi:hypothetical protein